MKKFKTRPTIIKEINAIQVTDDWFDESHHWKTNTQFSLYYEYNSSISVCKHPEDDYNYAIVHTERGYESVLPGGWIIINEDGNYEIIEYDEDFQEMYEPVEE